MANSHFNWGTNPGRMVRFDTARAEDVNAMGDDIEAGFDSVDAELAGVKHNPVFTGHVTVPEPTLPTDAASLQTVTALVTVGGVPSDIAVTALNVGSMTNGQYLKRSGSALVGGDPIPTQAPSDNGLFLQADGAGGTDWVRATPDPTGNAGKFLTTDGENLSFGIPAEFSDAAPVGTIIYSPTAPSAKWLKCDGASYLQSSYAALYALLGQRSELMPMGWRTPSGGPSTGTSIQQIDCNANAFFSVNSSQNVGVSQDGYSWSYPYASVGSVTPLSNGKVAILFAAGTTMRYSNDNGATWSSVVTFPTGNVSANNKLIYLGGRYFAQTGSVPYLMTSTDLDNWSNCAGLSSTLTSGSTDWSNKQNPELGGFAYANGVWIAASSASTGQVFTSTDGVNFTSRTPGVDSSYVARVFGCGNRVFATSDARSTTGYLRSSSDGITWSGTHPLTGTSSPGDVKDIKYLNGVYYAWSMGGSYGHVFRSTDGITWTILYKQPVGEANPSPNNGTYSGQVITIGNHAYWASMNTGAWKVWSLIDDVVTCETIQTAGVSPMTALSGGSSMSYPRVYGNTVYWCVLNLNTSNIVRKRVGYPADYTNPFGTGITSDCNAGYLLAVNKRVMLAGTGSPTSISNASAISESTIRHNTATEFAVPTIAPRGEFSTAYIKAIA